MMAENRLAPLSYDGFWSENPSNSNVGGISMWCKKDDMSYFEWKVRFGDRLEFEDRNPHERWAIYIGQWGNNSEQLLHFAPASDDGVGFWSRPTSEICVESVKTALGAGRVRINNKQDHTWQPLDRADILDEIKRQLPDSTFRSACKVSLKDSEDFVNYCRYHDLHINFGLVGEWCFSWDSFSGLCVGDRLEFRSTDQPDCTHWVIYVGDLNGDHGQVVHLPPAKRSEKNFKGSSWPSSEGFSVEDKPDQLVLSVSKFTEIVGYDKVRINNERDLSYPPSVWPCIVDEIIHLLPDSEGRSERSFTFKKSEDFVNYCRYDDLRSNFGVVSGWCSTWNTLLPRPRPGDKLEFKRRRYEHWGIYVGDWEGKTHQVVHLTVRGGKYSKEMSSSSERSKNVKSFLSVHSIQEVLGTNEVRINNERDVRHPPFFGSHILRYVKRKLDDQAEGRVTEYHLISHNCEHFANLCRYNQRRCVQMLKTILRLPMLSVDK